MSWSYKWPIKWQLQRILRLLFKKSEALKITPMPHASGLTILSRCAEGLNITSDKICALRLLSRTRADLYITSELKGGG